VRAPGGALDAVRKGIESLEADTILVIDTHEAEVAVWGENLTLDAVSRRAAGVVVAGWVRDVPMLTEIGLPIAAWGVFPRRSSVGAAGEVGKEIRIHETPVRAGDIVLVDANGVVVVPQEHCEAVVEHFDSWMAAELQQSARNEVGESRPNARPDAPSDARPNEASNTQEEPS
jgi:regulator of RNase E activity RraA